MSATRRAEIAGGGIGGLATAAALARKGWQVRVHERGARLRDTGAGIYIYENGMKVLETLGAAEAAIAGCSRATTREMRDGRNRVLSVHRWGASGRVYSVLRQQLIEALAGAATRAGAEIVTGSEAVSATPDGTITFASGATAQADLVVAADGVNSRIRDGLGIPTRKRDMPDGAIRLLIPKTPEEVALGDTGTTVENWQGSRRILVTPVSDTELYIALTMLDSDTSGKATPVDVESWAAAFPHLRPLIERLGPGGRYDRFGHVKLKTWSQGRVAILGDAAHAMPPNLGQGGGTAMMNGLALATHLDGAADIPAALAAWERAERPITEHTQRMSIFFGRPASWPVPIQRGFFNILSKSRKVGELRTRTARHIPTGTA
ncbi:FAD-dependent monooxygenase [Paroceanicella profunda]|uniref:FAD-dependent monooxygenase n=1 Tax=Paroceanicella profunda TaxID=2579971 RepID=A0A5B8FHF6_9RHOB|nr:NAD(P)/FAD-dependent oxidoreductase [Paroceanicella profunda]QDL91948.1 FAD-dependent monooxygenase [Paroceanicella profunda]